jgi:tripartite-type tricarboxylate transporter receptor subunit TctC
MEEIGMLTKNRLAFASVFLAMTALTGGTHAQEYPARPIALIMPFPAGGPGDTMARNLATALGGALKQQVFVENPSGASGIIGSNRVAKAKPDGYTLLIMNIGMATAPALFRTLPYNVLTDFEHIGRVADVPMTVVARKGLPANTYKELVALAKASSQKLTFANAGIGSAAHLCALLFAKTIQTEFTTVPYKGAAPALVDLSGGHVDLLCDQTSTTSAHIKAGTIKTYGVTAQSRLATLPDVPTLHEQGLAGFEVLSWFGLWAPKGLPQPVMAKLVAGLQTAVADPAFKERLANLGAAPVPPSQANPEILRAYVKSEIERWATIIKEAGIYAE